MALAVDDVDAVQVRGGQEVDDRHEAVGGRDADGAVHLALALGNKVGVRLDACLGSRLAHAADKLEAGQLEDVELLQALARHHAHVARAHVGHQPALVVHEGHARHIVGGHQLKRRASRGTLLHTQHGRRGRGLARAGAGAGHRAGDGARLEAGEEGRDGLRHLVAQHVHVLRQLAQQPALADDAHHHVGLGVQHRHAVHALRHEGHDLAQAGRGLAGPEAVGAREVDRVRHRPRRVGVEPPRQLVHQAACRRRVQPRAGGQHRQVQAVDESQVLGVAHRRDHGRVGAVAHGRVLLVEDRARHDIVLQQQLQRLERRLIAGDLHDLGLADEDISPARLEELAGLLGDPGRRLDIVVVRDRVIARAPRAWRRLGLRLRNGSHLIVKLAHLEVEQLRVEVG
mmetsp:Transcript_95921/g.266391  ORF Transcript_95921/g.266391 Transcript_95921/m.266391 type:complete len:399 (-) Transcript_95921:16-1212(-)